MAVDFYRKPDVLVRDLKQRGWRVLTVDSKEGDSRRAVQIQLDRGLSVNWDRDSRSIWAEGPYPEVERLEGQLRKLYQGGWMRRVRANPGTLAVVILASLLIALAFSYGISSSQPRLGQSTEAGPAAVPPAADDPSKIKAAGTGKVPSEAAPASGKAGDTGGQSR